MSVKGQLRTDQLTLGRFSVDWMKNQGLQVQVLAGLIDTQTGQTRGWLDGTGIIWSERTARALEALRQAVEEDLAAAHLVGGGLEASPKEGFDFPSEGGLAEYLGGDEPPSV